MKKFLLIVFLFIVCIEGLLRVDGRLKTHTEKLSGNYVNPYSVQNYKPVYTFHHNQKLPVGNNEYSYEYETNSIGLIHNEISQNAAENEIVFLGDSFTFGMGAPSDSSFVNLLQIKTDSLIPNCQFQMLNAGMPGSDPFFQYKLMHEIYLPKGIKNFVFVMNVSDLYDYIFRGGLERFTSDNSLKEKKAPWFEPAYKFSFIIRALVHGVLKMDYSLLTPTELNHQKIIAVGNYVQLFEKIAKEINALNGQLFIVLHPYPAYYDKSNQLKNQVMDYTFIDLLYYELYYRGINAYNLEPDFKQVLNSENYLNYCWKEDGHFNSAGYFLFTHILHERINNQLKSICEK